jgi:hypothetical protein
VVDAGASGGHNDSRVMLCKTAGLMNKIDYNAPVSVVERGASEVDGRLSISNIPLSWALHTIRRWPQERREGVLIETPDRVFPWADIDDLYGRLYNWADTGSGLSRRMS